MHKNDSNHNKDKVLAYTLQRKATNEKVAKTCICKWNSNTESTPLAKITKSGNIYQFESNQCVMDGGIYYIVSQNHGLFPLVLNHRRPQQTTRTRSIYVKNDNLLTVLLILITTEYMGVVFTT